MARLDQSAANVSRAAERCRARGFAVSFHHHAGTYVETPREVSALFDRVDPALVGLCFDTGHCAFGGGDTVAFLREYGEIVTHVHVKDVDLSLLERLHRRGAGLEEAWASGAFCELGTGGAAVPECLTELERLGYDGWIVVEQDRILAPGTPWSEVVDSGARNRAWLRDHGFE